MQTQTTKWMIELAEGSDDPIAHAVTESVEQGIVLASALRPKLAAMELKIEAEKLKVLTQVRIFRGDELIASGTSSDERDALLHAVYGYLKERA